jgi:hypothetical protein
MQDLIAELIRRYKRALAEKPLQTKMLTSAATTVIGECLGDVIRKHRGQKVSEVPLTHRCGFYGLYGLVFVGPLFHWWYDYMQKLTSSLSQEYKVFATLLIDRLVFTPPFLVFTLFYRQLLNNNSMSDKYRAVMKVIMSALWVNWKVWTALVAFNITYIPLEYRSIFGNVFALAWNTYLSLIS